MKKLWNGVKHYIGITDKWLLFLWMLASVTSLLYLWGLYNSKLTFISKLFSQGAAIGIGFVIAIVISQFDYHSLVKLWKIYLPVCLVLVSLTYVFGTVRGSDKAWLLIDIAGKTLSMQPSELLKISFITTFALHISKVENNLNSLPNICMLCLHGLGHVLVIQLLQNDGGTALIFVFIFLIMIFCSGISWKYVAAALASLVVVVPLLWFKLMSPDQKMRFMIVYNPDINADYAYQQIRSVMALGIGGLQGTGIFSGRHVRVPEVYNDFIFAFIGESSGFMGCLGVIILLSAIAFKVLYNSSVAKDTLGKFICIGVFAMIISQTFINLGMCLSLLPVIGVTLPLLSAGGTSVLSMYMGLGLVLSVYCNSSQGLFSKS